MRASKGMRMPREGHLQVARTWHRRCSRETMLHRGARKLTSVMASQGRPGVVLSLIGETATSLQRNPAQVTMDFCGMPERRDASGEATHTLLTGRCSSAYAAFSQRDGTRLGLGPVCVRRT
jgi:hypothetical protein